MTAMPSITGGHHVALTVSDADRSADWYCSLLNMQVALAGDSEDVKFRVLAHPESGWVLGVRQYPTRRADSFDEFRTGLDHFAFGVATRAELENWQRELSSRGITFTPIAETPIGSVIVFRDPDNIQLEFWLPTA
jgi:glyoxylase I family protein